MALAMLALSAAGCLAEPERTPVPLKPATVPERGLELPFDFKTEPSMKFQSENAPPVQTLLPHERARPLFFGLGVTRPIEVGK